jgi:hypothetical protein
VVSFTTSNATISCGMVLVMASSAIRSYCNETLPG